jgi:hypothetical protein
MSLSATAQARCVELLPGVLGHPELDALVLAGADHRVHRIGLEVVQGRGGVAPWVPAENMVMSNDPCVDDLGGKAMGCMANTYVVTPERGESMSSLALDIVVA